MVRMGEDRVKVDRRMFTRIRDINRLNYLYYSYGGEDGEDKMVKLQRLCAGICLPSRPRPAARIIESRGSSSPRPFFKKMRILTTCLWVKMVSLDLHPARTPPPSQAHAIRFSHAPIGARWHPAGSRRPRLALPQPQSRRARWTGWNNGCVDRYPH